MGLTRALRSRFQAVLQRLRILVSDRMAQNVYDLGNKDKHILFVLFGG